MTLLGTAQVQAHGSLAEVTIYDRTEGRWLTVHRHQGRAYVVGKPGHEYQIRVRSRQPEELLAVMSVDGVNIITGQTAHPSQSGYVISPQGSLETQGWRKNLSQTAAFYFTALPDSYASRTGRPDDVGVIGVALFRKKPAPQPPAPIAQAESRASRGAAAERADERLGTGHGRYETSHARHVAFERATASPAEVITLYYDSRANLVARGVIRERIPVAPRPFPEFVPDPQG